MTTADQVRGLYFPVLDKGFVSLVDYMGGDEDVIRAARTSYGKGTKKGSSDRNLLRYLKRHRHTTPFEMVELKFHIGMPMDSWRQHIRHRTASVNEYSTRYSEAIDATATTSPGGWREQSTTNKQGSGGFVDYEIGTRLSDREHSLHELSKSVYQERLDAGVAREQARKDLPLSTYTMAYWKSDLHNLLHFLTLRTHSHAQLEIRSYAVVMAALTRLVAPVTFEAWVDYDHQGVRFSRAERVALAELWEGKKPDAHRLAELGLTDREMAEFLEKVTEPAPAKFEIDPLDAMPAEHFAALYGTKISE